MTRIEELEKKFDICIVPVKIQGRRWGQCGTAHKKVPLGPCERIEVNHGSGFVNPNRCVKFWRNCGKQGHTCGNTVEVLGKRGENNKIYKFSRLTYSEGERNYVNVFS